MPARQLRNCSVQLRCSWRDRGLEETRVWGRGWHEATGAMGRGAFSDPLSQIPEGGREHSPCPPLHPEVTRHKRCRSPGGSPESLRRHGHGEEKVRGRPPPAQWRSKEHPNSRRARLYHRGGRFLGCAW